jgi:hypothetical protein
MPPRQLPAAMLLLAWCAAASPTASDGTWRINTFLLEPALRGATQLAVKDCRGITKQGRLRLSFAEEEEEEAAVASIECPAKSLIKASSIVAAQASAPCDLSADLALLPARCRKMAEAARGLPGISSSYKTAQRLNALIPTGIGIDEHGSNSRNPGRSASFMQLSSSSSVRGRSPTVEESGAAYPGLIKLSAALLFSHAANASVRGAAPLDSIEVAAAVKCPADASGQQCSGRGSCELAACACDNGWGGSACETPLCGASGCGAHGDCAGASGCVCHEGWTGEACAEAVCVTGCSGHGTCLHGVCSCAKGFHGESCGSHTAAACQDACNGNGNCALAGVGSAPVCLCHSKFVGASCDLEIGCPSDCSGHGQCKGGQCQCYLGYAGPECKQFCPHNCTMKTNLLGTDTPQGRCAADFTCVCKEGFSGPDCSQECPSRCFGHGDCVDGMCSCRDGYRGVDCGELAPITLVSVFLVAVQGYYPIMMITLFVLCAMIGFCCLGYCFNRWRGKFGTAAVPLFDYYAKRWRNAPLFEPIFAVSASTQTPGSTPRKGR